MTINVYRTKVLSSNFYFIADFSGDRICIDCFDPTLQGGLDIIESHHDILTSRKGTSPPLKNYYQQLNNCNDFVRHVGFSLMFSAASLEEARTKALLAGD